MHDDPSKGENAHEGEGRTAGFQLAQPVVIEQIRDPKMARGVKTLIFVGAYLGFLFTVAVIATALTPGPPF